MSGPAAEAQADNFMRKRKLPPSAALQPALQASRVAAQRPGLSRTSPKLLRAMKALRRALRPWGWLPALQKPLPQQQLRICSQHKLLLRVSGKTPTVR